MKGEKHKQFISVTKMNQYRFHLEKYKLGNRYTCPKCERKRCFARYIDDEGRISFPDNVGKCDHEHSCGYHYTPKDYFREHPNSLTNDKATLEIKQVRANVAPKPISYVDCAVMERSMSHYEINPLYRYLCKVIGEQETERLMKMYHVGTSYKWGGSTIYWQVDKEGKVRTGKVMLYNPKDGHRVKEPRTYVGWAHSFLHLADFNLCQCFFGEHLLMQHPMMSVAIVESEKTAIIASHFKPNFIWLATGGMHGCLNQNVVKVLGGREIILFPDLGATDKWKSKLPLLQSVCKRVVISNILEDNATEEQKAKGLDIADFLLMTETPQMVLQRLVKRYPPLQHLIDSLGLVLVEEP